MTSGLFTTDEHQPLADRLRPKSVSEMVGQKHLLSQGAPIYEMLQSKKIRSMILWGTPGCGKTTLARLIAQDAEYQYISISAIFSGVQELKKHFDQAIKNRQAGLATILFVDEIHRFNRAQQDSFLPLVENGTIILIGATTENPSFEINSALLSRMMVFEMAQLSFNDCAQLVARAETLIGKKLPLSEDAVSCLLAMADGDGRYLLNMIEAIFDINTQDKILDEGELTQILQKKMPIYDKNRDGHYNLISALHKSVRGSDCQASLYWFCRMIHGGETPHFIARRLVKMAYEDIGLADINAAQVALNAWNAYERLGSPEGELALANAVIYLANAPKSNAGYVAYKNALNSAGQSQSLAPPKIILNAPTSMMKKLGYGAGYLYDHDQEDGFSGQNYFPDKLMREEYYEPVERGFERDLKKRMDYFKQLRIKRNVG